MAPDVNLSALRKAINLPADSDGSTGVTPTITKQLNATLPYYDNRTTCCLHRNYLLIYRRGVDLFASLSQNLNGCPVLSKEDCELI